MNRNVSITIKLTKEEKKTIITKAAELGFTSFSDYLRYIGLNTSEIQRSTKK
jgi:uncharacterized protein (DUF1778 family)